MRLKDWKKRTKTISERIGVKKLFIALGQLTVSFRWLFGPWRVLMDS